jgi:glycosyltransferase involved in cell wall biosynthesis
MYKVAQEKISVIHSAVDDKFRIVDHNDKNLVFVKEKYLLPYKFILYLGTIEPRKNLIGIIRAFNELQEWAKETGNVEIAKYKLVLAGAKGWLNKRIFEEIWASASNNSIEMVDFVYDRDKEYLYNLASLFIYPSFFEGFGFPPLEAMKCGVPVITSNNSSLPEVVGDSGILIDPDRPDEIFRAMREILSDRDFRRRLSEKGQKKANEFNWKSTAKMTLDVLISTM